VSGQVPPGYPPPVSPPGNTQTQYGQQAAVQPPYGQAPYPQQPSAQQPSAQQRYGQAPYAAPYPPAPAPYAQTPAPLPPYALQPQVRTLPQWQAYLKMQLGAGRPRATLFAEMCASGVPQPQAHQLLQEVVGALQKRAFLTIGIGAALVIVGLLVTFATMSTAASEGYYLVWYGPVAIGIVAAAYGILLLSKIPRQ
jgi:hypothetical protein